MILKRLFDVVVSALGLVVLLPLFISIGVWIKLDSRGPVFFRQDRVGLHGRLFRIHKFRTMLVQEQGDGPAITTREDRRITRAGQFLRRYKLDELPQLIDVLKGDMSLVGPRPEVPRYMACYPEQDRVKVLSVRPGMTDWASLRFRDESALLDDATDFERVYTDEILPIKRKLYLEYVENRTFVEDLKILFATLAVIWNGSAGPGRQYRKVR